MELLDHVAALYVSQFEKVPDWLYHFIFSPAVHEDADFFMSSTSLLRVIITLWP